MQNFQLKHNINFMPPRDPLQHEIDHLESKVASEERALLDMFVRQTEFVNEMWDKFDEFRDLNLLLRRKYQSKGDRYESGN